MKGTLKYVVSAIVFFIVFNVINYIFDKKIDIVFSLITTIIYFILYMVCDKIFTKKEK